MKRSVLISLILLGPLTACATLPIQSGSASLAADLRAINPAAELPTGQGSVDLSQPLTPDRAVQVAFENNPDVRAAMARLDAIQAKRLQAGLIQNPMLSLMALRPEGGGRYQLQYGLMQSLYELLARSRRVSLADAEARRREAEVLSEWVSLAQAARSAAVKAWFATQALRIEQQRWALEEHERVRIERLANQGTTPLDAVLEQRALVASQTQAVSDAEATQTVARSRLAQRLGLSSAQGLILPADMPMPEVSGLDAAELQAWARQHRPEIRVAAAQFDQANAKRALTDGTFRVTRPSLGVEGMRGTDTMTLQGVSVQLMLPVFDDGQSQSRLVEAQVEQAGHRADALRRRVSLEVETALANVVFAQAELKQAQLFRYQQQQMEALARRQYQSGVIDRGRFLEMARRVLMSDENHLRAQQALWLSLLELERAAGKAVLDGNVSKSSAE